MVGVWRGNCAAARQQACRRQSGPDASGFECLGFAAVAVGLVEQHLEQRREFGGQGEGGEFVRHAFNGQRLLAFLFQTGERGGQDVGRRLAEASFAFAVEIDRRGMQGKQ